MPVSKLESLLYDLESKLSDLDEAKCILEYVNQHIYEKQEEKDSVKGNENLYTEIVKFANKAVVSIINKEHPKSWWPVTQSLISVRRFVYALETWGPVIKTNDLLANDKLYYVSEMIESLQYGPYEDTSKNIKEFGLGDILIERKGIPHHVEAADKEMTELYFKMKPKK